MYFGPGMQRVPFSVPCWGLSCKWTVNNKMATYRDVLLQPALREDPVELRAELPLGQDRKHHALEHHGLRALRTHNRGTFTYWCNMSGQPPPPPPPISAGRESLWSVSGRKHEDQLSGILLNLHMMVTEWQKVPEEAESSQMLLRWTLIKRSLTLPSCVF